jgi:hypothetical protein
MERIGVYRDEKRVVSVSTVQGTTVVMISDITSALATLLADLDKIAVFVPQPPNYLEHLYELRKEMFGY